MQLGSLDTVNDLKQKREVIKAEMKPATISHYGTQDTAKSPDGEEPKDFDAILFGTALHYLLEMMGSFDQGSLDEAMTSMLNRYGQLLHQDKTEEIYRRAKSLIRDQAFQSLLENATILKEQSLSYEGKIKQIDLLLEYEDSYLVIDYKSSRKFHEEHLRQVAAYQKVIEKITDKRTEGMIIYLLEGETLFVP